MKKTSTIQRLGAVILALGLLAGCGGQAASSAEIAASSGSEPAPTAAAPASTPFRKHKSCAPGLPPGAHEFSCLLFAKRHIERMVAVDVHKRVARQRQDGHPVNDQRCDLVALLRGDRERHTAALGHLLITARTDTAAGAARDRDGEFLLLRPVGDGDIDRRAGLDHCTADRALARNGALLHIVIVGRSVFLHSDAEALGRRLRLLEREADKAWDRDRGVLRSGGLLLRSE